MGQSKHDPGAKGKPAWNDGRKLGAKRALKPQQVWAIRFWLDSKKRMRDRAMFDFAIDSKLRGCDVVKIKIGDIVLGRPRPFPPPSWSNRRRSGRCSSSCSTTPRAA